MAEEELVEEEEGDEKEQEEEEEEEEGEDDRFRVPHFHILMWHFKKKTLQFTW